MAFWSSTTLSRARRVCLPADVQQVLGLSLSCFARHDAGDHTGHRDQERLHPLVPLLPQSDADVQHPETAPLEPQRYRVLSTQRLIARGGDHWAGLGRAEQHLRPAKRP